MDKDKEKEEAVLKHNENIGKIRRELEETKAKLTTSEEGLKRVSEENCNLNQIRKELEVTKTKLKQLKTSEENSQIFEDNVEMKIKLVSTETTLKNKTAEFAKKKENLEKEIEEMKKSSDDINLMRLRKAHAELKKEQI